MTSDINPTAIIMSPNDVCTLLDIKESTLRKYALLLKNAGYAFHTNDKGQRAYYEKDVIVIKRFLEVKNNPDMTLEQSANAVMSWVKTSNVSLRDMTNNSVDTRYNDDIKELKTTVQQQTDLIKELINKMDQQQKYIEKKIDERDAQLTMAIRAIQEQKLIAAAKEDESKKGFWSRLLGK